MENTRWWSKTSFYKLTATPWQMTIKTTNDKSDVNDSFYRNQLKFLMLNSGKICEPAHFPRLNKEEALENYLQKATGTSSKVCAQVVRDADIYYPAYEPVTEKCILQGQTMLYSCVGAVSRLRRICPCRDYIPGQTALCANCLWHKS